MSIRFQYGVRPSPASGRAAEGSFLRRLLFLGLLCLLAAGCTADAYRSYARAVGPELHSQSTVRNTQLLALYTSHICAQAGLGDCRRQLQSHEWRAFVQMGLYDIDQRCDAFLDSLYYKDKTRGPILQQISSTRSFTRSILEVSAASSTALRVVAAAFDLTESLFSNARNALLDALDPTTVKTLVYGNQRKLKAEIAKASAGSLPEAYHILRAYLRVCMPHAIEMEANAILTTGQRTDGTGGTSPLVGIGEIPDARAPIVPTPPAPGVKNAANAIEEGLAPQQVREIQRLLCAAEDADFGTSASSETRLAIKAFESGEKASNPVDAARIVADGVMTTADERANLLDAVTLFNIRNVRSCKDAGLLSAFEAGYFSIDGIAPAVGFIAGDVVELAETKGLLTPAEAAELTGRNVTALDQSFRNLVSLLREKHGLPGKNGEVDSEFVDKAFR